MIWPHPMPNYFIPEITSDRSDDPFVIDLGPDNSRYPMLRELIIDELGRRISELAEAAYGAAWILGLEERLPVICDQAVKTGMAQPIGDAFIWPETAKLLLDLRSMLGHWVVPKAMGGYEPLRKVRQS